MGKRIDISELSNSVKPSAKSGQEEHPLTDKQIEALLNNIAFNLKDLISLNHNVAQLRRRLYEFLQTMPDVKEYVHQQAKHKEEKEAFENLCKASRQLTEHIDSKLKESESRIRKIDGYVAIPINSIYIVLILILALSTFMLCILILNIQFWHSSLIWKCLGITTGIAAIGITLVLYLPKWIRKFEK